jgi:hypothetical protein
MFTENNIAPIPANNDVIISPLSCHNIRKKHDETALKFKERCKAHDNSHNNEKKPFCTVGKGNKCKATNKKPTTTNNKTKAPEKKITKKKQANKQVKQYNLRQRKNR